MFSLDNSDARYTPDITGAGYEYNTGYSIIVQLKDTKQVKNIGVTDQDTRVRTSPLTR